MDFIGQICVRVFGKEVRKFRNNLKPEVSMFNNVSLTYVPTEVTDRIDDISGVLKKHNQAQVVEITPKVITVDIFLPMGGNKRSFRAKLHADDQSHNALANWLGVQNLLRWYSRLARTNELRAKLGLMAWS